MMKALSFYLSAQLLSIGWLLRSGIIAAGTSVIYSVSRH
jgi:hypothetical protein